MHRHTIQQTVMYVQTCDTANRYVCTDLSQQHTHNPPPNPPPPPPKKKKKKKPHVTCVQACQTANVTCSDLPHTRHFFFFSVLPSTSVWDIFSTNVHPSLQYTSRSHTRASLYDKKNKNCLHVHPALYPPPSKYETIIYIQTSVKQKIK